MFFKHKIFKPFSVLYIWSALQKLYITSMYVRTYCICTRKPIKHFIFDEVLSEIVLWWQSYFMSLVVRWIFIVIILIFSYNNKTLTTTKISIKFIVEEKKLILLSLMFKIMFFWRWLGGRGAWGECAGNSAYRREQNLKMNNESLLAMCNYTHALLLCK